MLDPATIKSPRDLPLPLPYVEEGRQSLQLGAKRPFQFSFNWLREILPGAIDGDLGLLITGAGQVEAGYVLTGTFKKELDFDDAGRLRLRIFQCRTPEFGPAFQVSVTAETSASLPPKAVDLLAAILGIHWQQWLRALSEAARSAPQQIERLLPGFPLDGLRRFFEVWDGLDAGAATALWEATPSLEALRQVTGFAVLPEDVLSMLIRLKERAGQVPRADEVLRRLRDLAGFKSLDEWVRTQLEKFFGPVKTEDDVKRLLERLSSLGGLRDEIYEKALAALQRKYEAELALSLKTAGEETALLDCSFAFTESGLALFRRAWAADFSWLGDRVAEDVAIHSAVLTSRRTETATVELHLPFMDRKTWHRRLEALASVEVTTDEGGRLLVYHLEASHRVELNNSYQSVLALAGAISVGRLGSSSNFTLSYTDSRRLDGRRAWRELLPVLESYGFATDDINSLDGRLTEEVGEVEAALAISLDGAFAAAWLDGPDERSPEFFPVYARVAQAVQKAMRAWIPYLYFSDLRRYGDLEAAFPLVVYQASPPFACKPKCQFNYDVMSSQSMDDFFQLAASRLPRELSRIAEVLEASGRAALAVFYKPWRARRILASVQQKPRLLHALLVGDAFLTEAVINLGCRGSELRRRAGVNPAQAVKEAARYAADFVKAFHAKMRRLYAGREFLALGSLLLVEATAALRGESPDQHAVKASLRISGDRVFMEGPRLLLNEAWQARPQ